MATITLYVGLDCDEWETQIRNAIQELPGEEDVEVQVKNTGHVVVQGGNASAGNIQGQLYNKVGLRAAVVSETYALPDDGDDTDDDDEEEEDDEEEDKDDNGDDTDGDGDGGGGGGGDDDDDDNDGGDDDDDNTDDDEDYFSC